MIFGLKKQGTLPRLEGANGCIVSVRQDGTIIDSSPSADVLVSALKENNATLKTLLKEAETGLPVDGRFAVPDVGNFWVVVTAHTEGFYVVARETTLSDRMTDALLKSRSMMKSLLDRAVDISFEVDENRHFTFISPMNAFGRNLELWLGELADDLFWPKGNAPVRNPLASKKSDAFPTVAVELNAGQLCWLNFSVEPAFDQDGTFKGVRGTCRDVTEQVQNNRKTRRDNLRLALHQRITRQLNSSDSPEDILDNASAELADVLRADMVWSLVHYEDGLVPVAVSGEAEIVPDINGIWQRLEKGDNTVIEAQEGQRTHLAIRLEQGARSVGMVLVSRDTETTPWADYEKALLEDVMESLASAFGKAELIEQLRRLSTQDELTGLANRRAFVDLVERRLRAQKRSGRSGCMLFIDLDHFKAVNDTLGHKAGDEVLKLVAAGMKSLVRETDCAGRLGGDEFVVWLEDIHPADAGIKAHTILEMMKDISRTVGAEKLGLGASIGICKSVPGQDMRFDHISERADAALYEVKKAGRNNIAFADTPAQPSDPQKVAAPC